MLLRDRIQQELNHLLPITDGSPQTLLVAVDGGKLRCALTAADQLACAFEEFAYEAPQLANAPWSQLDQIASALSRKLSYLLETISPVERDQDRCVVQMRSNPPQQEDDGTAYYELVVRRGELALCRYSKARGQARRVIPAQVTWEVFCRLATDFSQAATQ
jgi:hypothetical protein